MPSQLSTITRLAAEHWMTVARLKVSENLSIELATNAGKFVIAYDWVGDETDFTWLGSGDQIRATAWYVRTVTRHLEGEFGADLLTIVRGEAA